ncbi:hypothetical protein KRMM14A1259_58070 [Krasilnikovia sp. MM14-A1259]
MIVEAVQLSWVVLPARQTVPVTLSRTTRPIVPGFLAMRARAVAMRASMVVAAAADGAVEGERDGGAG